jgi:hypothetical protein
MPFGKTFVKCLNVVFFTSHLFVNVVIIGKKIVETDYGEGYNPCRVLFYYFLGVFSLLV